MKVGIVGTGYVGLVTGTCLSHLGHDVIAVDINQAKIDNLNKGNIPIYEPGLKELLEPLLKKKIFFNTTFSEFKEVQVVFIAVGTPSGEDGSADLQYVFAAAESLCSVLANNAIVILKSTVPVGTASEIKKILKKHKREDLKVVSNPEFLKEGAAINDFLYPDRIVVGADDETAFKVMDELYACITKVQNSKLLKMSNVSAELTKYAANCFLATKISFMNEMAQLCEKVSADIDDIKVGIGTDPRIGNLFLNPGPGYGGSCFPKDVKALLHIAENKGVNLKVINAAELANEKAKAYAAERIESLLGNLNQKKIAVWGLAFKAMTDDVRESSSIATIRTLLAKGVSAVHVFDPEALSNFMEYFLKEKRIKPFTNLFESLIEVDALIILTEWNIIKTIDVDMFKSAISNKPVLDMRNLFPLKQMRATGLNYYSLGRP